MLLAASIFATMPASLQAGVPVIWDGTTGLSGIDLTFHAPAGYSRFEQGNWTRDGGTPGQTAADALTTVIGQNQDGHVGGRGGLDVVIGGGAKVFHDQNRNDMEDPNNPPNRITVDGPAGLGDFKPRMDQHGPGSLTIKEGATLWMDAHTDTDGRWARMDINTTIDNGTLKTTHQQIACPLTDPCSVSAGRLIFGYQDSLLPNTILNWNIINGGRIEMEGKMYWGNPDYLSTTELDAGHYAGIGMNMTINGGTLDLTGGNLWQDTFGLADGEMVFWYLWDGVTNQAKNESYILNFTGPGQIIVDTGLFVVEQNSSGGFAPKGGLAPDLLTSMTYEDLWTLGILQANGVTGPGGTFSNYFSVSGSPGSPNYTLTSLLAPPGQDGDHNEDGFVNAADYPAWRKIPSLFGDEAGYTEWRQNFGEGGPAGSAPVPEPASLTVVMLSVAGLWLGRRGYLRAV